MEYNNQNMNNQNVYNNQNTQYNQNMNQPYNNAPVYNNNRPPVDSDYEEGYISIVKHVLLCLFTFGIWQFVWIYKTTKFLNRMQNEEYNDPTTKLLLCMFVPFYMLYWIYKQSQRIDKYAVYKGVDSSESATINLILSIFGLSLVSYILMQDKINKCVSGTINQPQYGA